MHQYHPGSSKGGVKNHNMLHGSAFRSFALLFVGKKGKQEKMFFVLQYVCFESNISLIYIAVSFFADFHPYFSPFMTTKMHI